MIFLNNRQYNQAAAAFKRVIKADASLEAHYGLGQAYLGIEAFDDAEAAANEALKRNPKHQPTRELIQLIKFARNREKNRETRKKILPYVAILGIIALGIFIETRFNIIPWPNRNLNLSIQGQITLEAPSKNRDGFLDAGKTGYLKLRILNNANMTRNIELIIQPSVIPGVDFENSRVIKKLQKNKHENMRVRMTADKDVQARRVPLQIQLFGKTGWFGKKEALLEPTAEFDLIITAD